MKVMNKAYGDAHAADRLDDCEQLDHNQKEEEDKKEEEQGKREKSSCYSCAFQSELGLCRAGVVFAEW